MKTQSVPPSSLSALFLAVIAALLAGCGTKELAGVKEYKQITAEGLAAVKAALQSLEQVSAHTNHCPPRIVSSFGQQVQRLQVDSIRVRARSQAILARGDAYFAAWSESIANIKDPRVRQLAERFQPELENSFSKIKLASQKAGGAFKPFLSGLQKVRAELESKPDGIAADSGTDLIRDTRANGQQVEQELETINSELNTITTMLTPTKSSAHH